MNLKINDRDVALSNVVEAAKERGVIKIELTLSDNFKIRQALEVVEVIADAIAPIPVIFDPIQQDLFETAQSTEAQGKTKTKTKTKNK